MKSPLLTVGIPTWNRCEDLRVAIDSILCQLTDELREQIEILVSDNASTDATHAVLETYRSKDPELIAVNRNSRNIGFSRNVDALFRQACGEFVLVLSDDDALEPDSLREIVFVLKEHRDINILFVQVGEYDNKLFRPINPEAWAHARESRALGDSCTYYASGLEYFRAHKSFCDVCISGNVYRVSAWKSVDMEAGLGSGSVQLHAAVQIHARGSSCVIRRPLIKYRASAEQADYVRVRAGGYESGFPFVYHFDVVQACRNGRSLYPPAVYRAFYLTCVRGVFYTLLDVKAHHVPINENYFLTRLNGCFDPDCFGWFIPLFRFLLKLPPLCFMVPNHLYRWGRSAYFGLFK